MSRTYLVSERAIRCAADELELILAIAHRRMNERNYPQATHEQREEQ